MGPLSTARSTRDAGFTLVEVLVVLFILGLALALVTVSLAHDDRREVSDEAKRLAGALEYAAALAQWRAETLGISAEGDGYRFWRRDTDNRWIALAGDEVLVPRRLPAGLSVIALKYANAPIATDAILPFRASGRNEPYALRLQASGAAALLAGDPLNRVEFVIVANDATGAR